MYVHNTKLKSGLSVRWNKSTFSFDKLLLCLMFSNFRMVKHDLNIYLFVATGISHKFDNFYQCYLSRYMVKRHLHLGIVQIHF